MIFNSVTFLLFLLLVVMLYWVLPGRSRYWLVFASSIAFYGFWRVEFIPLMLASVVTDYFVAQRIQSSATQQQKKSWLLVSLTVNLGLLFVFKYLIFFTENVFGVARALGVETDPVTLNIILPLGISFYTFQTISYTVDVYRGFIKPEKNFLLFGCYVTFFPQLVAGPILRAVEVIPQFRERPPLQLTDMAIGIRRILYGLFLKVVVADNIAPLVDSGFALSVGSLSAIDVWTLAFLFGFQIYFDFSAYSHIALGSARLMGIRFPENFNFPYLAASPKDFWGRWHISLSSWIRDYLYLPLTGAKVQDRSTGGLTNAVAGHKKTSALFLTWVLMGFWHGANWTFLLWGLMHAALIFAYRIVSPHVEWMSTKVRALCGFALTIPLVMLAWIPFRSPSLSDAFSLLGKVLVPSQYFWMGLRENTYLVTAILAVSVLSCNFFQRMIQPALAEKPAMRLVSESAMFAAVIGLVFVFLRPINQFIYFQF